MPETDTDIQEVVVEKAGVPTRLEVELDAQKAIARISAISNVLDACVKVSIQRTNPKDWVRMMHNQKQKDGSYKKVESFYLQATGAQKIRGVWGIYYRDREISRETLPDGHYSYIVTGKVGSKLLDNMYGEVIVEIDGARSSSDDFFSAQKRTPDPMDVRKAATANWEARAVTALLGLKNMSADDLQKNGIDVSKVAGFEFEKGAEGGGKTAFISQAQEKRLFAICKTNGLSGNQLKAYLELHHKIKATSEIKRGEQYDAICYWADTGGSAREPGEEG